MPTAPRIRRRRLVVVGLGAALLVPLSMTPAGAQAPSGSSVSSAASPAGTTVVGTLVQTVAAPKRTVAKRTDTVHVTSKRVTTKRSATKNEATGSTTVSWIKPLKGRAVRVPTSEVAGLPVGATVKVTLGPTETATATGPAALPARQVLASSVVSATTAATVAAASTVTPGANEVTVVKVHPGGDTTSDPTSVNTVIAEINGAVNDYWKGQTRQAVQLTAVPSSKVDDWVTSTFTCDDTENLYDDVATQISWNPGPGKHLLLYFSNDPTLPCDMMGDGELSSGTSVGDRAYVAGQDGAPELETSAIVQDLGRNFGLGWSSEHLCDRSMVYGNCADAPSADYYDPMGETWEQMGALNALQQNQLGVLDPGEVQDLSGVPGTQPVTLSPTGTAGGTRAVVLGASDGLSYWLEYRSAVGQDEWLKDSRNHPASPLDQGVLLHVEPSGLEDASSGDTSLLLDATPSAAAGWADDNQEALKAGHSVWLSGLDYYVTVKSTSSTSAVLQIQAGTAPLSRDLDHNYSADLEIGDSSGNLYTYPSAPGGGFGTRTSLGGGWQNRDLIVMAGDFDGSGSAQDLIARNPANGDLLLYPGNGHGGLLASRVIGRGWGTVNALFSPGDWNGDGTPDLIMRRRSDGNLVLYPGNGTGGFKTPVTISTGNWNVMTSLVPTGDLDSNGTTDFVARKTDGTVYLYSGNGVGGFAPTTVLGHGWQGFASVTGVGDWDGDGLTDLLCRKTDGTLWLYSGTGDGRFLTARRIGTGLGAARLAV